MNEQDEKLWKFGNLLLECVSDYMMGRAKEAPCLDAMDFTRILAGEIKEAVLCKEEGVMN